jgi:hypothetical protein
MSQGLPFRQPTPVVGFLAVIQFALQASLLTRGVKDAAVSLTIDNTYYFLGNTSSGSPEKEIY